MISVTDVNPGLTCELIFGGRPAADPPHHLYVLYPLNESITDVNPGLN